MRFDNMHQRNLCAQSLDMTNIVTVALNSLISVGQ